MFSFLKWNELQGHVTKALVDDLNNLLQSQPIDDAIKNIEITDIDFGHIPPTLDVLDISEPDQEIHGRRGENIFNKRSNTTPRRKRLSFSSYGLASVLSNMASSGNEETTRRKSGGMQRRQTSNPFSSSAQRVSDVQELKKYYAQYPQRICSFKRTHPRFKRRNRELRGRYNPFSERKQIEKEIWKGIDVQIKTFFSYVGNLKLSISTVFQINEPVKNFIEVPLHVTVSHFKLAFLCVIIYRGKKDQVEIYVDPSPLTKSFDLAIELGDETDVFVDNNLIGDFLKRNVDLFLEERLIYPNRIRITGLAKRIESEVRVVMEKFKEENFKKAMMDDEEMMMKQSNRLRKKRFKEEEEEEENNNNNVRRRILDDDDENEGEASSDDDNDDFVSSGSSSDSDWVGRRKKRD